jgi:uncharacterized membrane protein
MNEELKVFLLSMAPVSELRGAIPLGILSYGFPIWKAYAIAVVGNFVIVAPFLFFLERFSAYLMERWGLFRQVMNWVFERTRRKHLAKFHETELKYFALFLFVAIPLPMTGAWTGTVVAYLLGIPFRRAVLAILLGVLLAGALVASLTAVGTFAVKNLI